MPATDDRDEQVHRFDFDEEIEARIEDGFLDLDEEEALRALGESYGLSDRGVSQRIASVCRRLKVPVERKARRELEHQVQAARMGGPLTGEEEAMLRRLGEELLAPFGRVEEGGARGREAVDELLGRAPRVVEEVGSTAALYPPQQQDSSGQPKESEERKRAEGEIGASRQASPSLWRRLEKFKMIGGLLVVLLFAILAIRNAGAFSYIIRNLVGGGEAVAFCKCDVDLWDLDNSFKKALSGRDYVEPEGANAFHWLTELQNACRDCVSDNRPWRSSSAQGPVDFEKIPCGPCHPENLKAHSEGLAFALHVAADGAPRIDACDYLASCLQIVPDYEDCLARVEHFGCDSLPPSTPTLPPNPRRTGAS